MITFPVGLREVDECILKFVNSKDLISWCWSDSMMHQLCRSTIVWKGRMIKVDSILSAHMLQRYKHFIDGLDLSDCDNMTVRKIEGFSLEKVSFRGNSWIDDETFEDFLTRNCGNCRFVDMSNCLNLTNKSLFAIAKNCAKIESINCSGGLISVSGVLALRDLKQITTLKLSNCLLLSTDNILSVVSQFPRLKELDVSINASVSFNMLCMLMPLAPSLRTIDVRGCEDLNGYQVERLKAMFPHVKVKDDAKIYDDSIESVRAYLLGMLRSQ